MRGAATGQVYANCNYSSETTTPVDTGDARSPPSDIGNRVFVLTMLPPPGSLLAEAEVMDVQWSTCVFACNEPCRNVYYYKSEISVQKTTDVICLPARSCCDRQITDFAT